MLTAQNRLIILSSTTHLNKIMDVDFIRGMQDESAIEELLKALKKHTLVPDDKKIELDAQAYMWHKFSFIPWHSDKDSYDEVRFAATLYLNKEWDDNWGGLFLYKKNDCIHAEAPRFNKLVFNDQNYEHATSMLTSTAPFRFTVQLFWKIQNE